MNRKPTAPSPRRRTATPQPPKGAVAGDTHALEHLDLGKAAPNGQIRTQMIAEAAYYHALHRGFDGSDTKADWFAAEHEIDAKLGNGA